MHTASRLSLTGSSLDKQPLSLVSFKSGTSVEQFSMTQLAESQSPEENSSCAHLKHRHLLGLEQISRATILRIFPASPK